MSNKTIVKVEGEFNTANAIVRYNKDEIAQFYGIDRYNNAYEFALMVSNRLTDRYEEEAVKCATQNE